MKVALTIAGSDPSGGAGLQADLKTFHQFGVFGTSVVTAVTVQNTAAVLGNHAVPPDIVVAQLAAVVGDLPPAATKTGMLGTGAVVEAVAGALRRHRLPHFVLDPVIIATSGGRLLDQDAVRVMTEQLLPLAEMVTPNLSEAAALTGHSVDDPASMVRAGHALRQMGAGAALIKGGHLRAERLVDVLVTAAGVQQFEHARIETTSTHGTGCTLSAAIVAGLALGRALELAVADAVEFVQRAIHAAPGLGTGHGPLQHRVDPPRG
ncbi:MAG TPA: bifunctional hydroxymethylpyrimidine kinase/phosphomethylpyrimidine kinase [Gemmatimonadales bacterium]